MPGEGEQPRPGRQGWEQTGVCQTDPPRGSLSASAKREEGVSPQLGDAFSGKRGANSPPVTGTRGQGDRATGRHEDGGSRGTCGHRDKGTRGHGDGLAEDKYSHGLPGPSPRGPDTTDPHAPQHKPTRARTPHGVCTPPASSPRLSDRTSASGGCLSIGPVGTLADGCGTAGQAPEPFPTGALPCELPGRAGSASGTRRRTQPQRLPPARKLRGRNQARPAVGARLRACQGREPQGGTLQGRGGQPAVYLVALGAEGVARVAGTGLAAPAAGQLPVVGGTLVTLGAHHVGQTHAAPRLLVTRHVPPGAQDTTVTACTGGGAAELRGGTQVWPPPLPQRTRIRETNLAGRSPRRKPRKPGRHAFPPVPAPGHLPGRSLSPF